MRGSAKKLRNPDPISTFYWQDRRAEPPFCFPHAPVALDPRSPQAAGHCVCALLTRPCEHGPSARGANSSFCATCGSRNAANFA